MFMFKISDFVTGQELSHSVRHAFGTKSGFKLFYECFDFIIYSVILPLLVPVRAGLSRCEVGIFNLMDGREEREERG